MNYPSHWKIFTTPAVSKQDFDKLKDMFNDWSTVEFKQKDEPVPRLICYNCELESVDDVADRLIQYDYDVIAVQSGSGPIP